MYCLNLGLLIQELIGPKYLSYFKTSFLNPVSQKRKECINLNPEPKTEINQFTINKRGVRLLRLLSQILNIHNIFTKDTHTHTHTHTLSALYNQKPFLLRTQDLSRGRDDVLL